MSWMIWNHKINLISQFSSPLPSLPYSLRKNSALKNVQNTIVQKIFSGLITIGFIFSHPLFSSNKQKTKILKRNQKLSVPNLWPGEGFFFVCSVLFLSFFSRMLKKTKQNKKTIKFIGEFHRGGEMKISIRKKKKKN